MRALALAASMLLAAEGRGQEGEPAPAGGSPAPAAAETAVRPPTAEEAHPGDEGIFLLRSGAALAGRLVARGSGGDVVELRSGERLRLPPGSVVGRLGPVGGREREPEPKAAPGPREVRVFLRDGRTVEGDLVERNDDRVRIRTPDGGTQEFQPSEVREVFFLSELRADQRGQPDPARNHYLHVPSAFGLGAGTYQVAATTIELPAVAFGVTDWLTLSAGAIAPLMYGTPIPRPGVTGALTASIEALPWLRAAGGVRAFGGPGGPALLLFGTVTAGTPSLHVSLYAGPPAPEAARLGRFDEVIAAVAGAARLSNRTGLLIETWVTPRLERPEALFGLAFRALPFDHLALDVGAVATTAAAVGPWLAVGWTDTWRSK